MECLVCKQKIQPDERVFWGSLAVCCGSGDTEFIYQVTRGDFMCVVHLDCLEKPVAASRISSVTAPGVSGLKVERSDALSLLMK